MIFTRCIGILAGALAYSSLGRAQVADPGPGSSQTEQPPVPVASAMPATSASTPEPPAQPVDSAKTGAVPANDVASSGTPSATDGEIKKLREELDQLRAEFDQSRTTSDTEDAEPRRIDLYGFMDMGFQRLWTSNQAAILATGTERASTFVLGNVNLYIDANPTQTWRALTELRLTNYPNGALEQPGVPALGQPEQRSSTSVPDVNAPDSGWNNVNWGGIVLEQAWLQGTFTDWFGVRAGYWLTPFGIWNIDHGSPTLIGLTPPSFTRGRFYPRQQLGVQVVGHVTTQGWTLGYTAYISNGKTAGNLDPTDDKAFGLRLSAGTMRPFPMTFGLAGYTGRYSQKVVETGGLTLLSMANREVVAYRQWDIGADASFDINALRVRTELALERLDYAPGSVEVAWNIPGFYSPNRLMWGWFTLAAYQLPWLGLEPYLSCELFRFPSPMSEAIAIPGVGLNIHFKTEVQLKTQYTRTYFFDYDGAHDHSNQNMSMLASRLVIAY